MRLIQSRVQISQCFDVDCKIADSIVQVGCEIQSAALSRSLIGRQTTVRGKGKGQFLQLNVGDNSHVVFMEPNGQ